MLTSPGNVTLRPQHTVVTSRLEEQADDGSRSRDGDVSRGVLDGADDAEQYGWQYFEHGRWAANQSQLFVTGLQPYTTYRVRAGIAAYTTSTNSASSFM